MMCIVYDIAMHEPPREWFGYTLYTDNNNITSIAPKSSSTRAQKRNKKSITHIQEPGTRGHHQFKGPIKGS